MIPLVSRIIEARYVGTNTAIRDRVATHVSMRSDTIVPNLKFAIVANIGFGTLFPCFQRANRSKVRRLASTDF
jgi:hypothetical protein